jgi:dynein heavy chain, axonemal
MSAFSTGALVLQVIEVIRKKYTSDPAFTPDTAKKASSAAEGLCKWVHAMDKYEHVAKARSCSEHRTLF